MSSPNNSSRLHQPILKPARQKKGIGIAIAALVLIGAAACSMDSEQPVSSADADTTMASSAEVAGENGAEQPAQGEADAAEGEAPEAPAEADVPMEYRQALRSAENYLSFSGFSYQGLYDQLTSEYADKFSPEAAQYAFDNVEADWNAEAVESAESYLEFSSMSPDGLYDQLTSEYGDKFTPEQAQHAVDTVFAQ